MPTAASSAAEMMPLLKECGYSGPRLATDYSIGKTRFALVGFAGKPWDRRSVCIAVTDGDGDSLAAAQSCRELGAPIAWVKHNGTVDWWILHGGSPTRYASKPYQEFAALVRKHKADLAPAVVNRALVAGRLPGERQLDFVDVGLMPLLEKEDGEKLGMLVEDMTRAVLQALGRRNPSQAVLRHVFTVVFRLLAGKILKDKEVRGFENIRFDEPFSVLRRVWRHYNTGETPPPFGDEWRRALTTACDLVATCGNLRVVSPETLAHVYEHTLVSKSLRKKLGIHATPPYLVDYVVWRLYDWIREIPEADRHVFEPACGHAPFLLATMRMLRMEMQGESEQKVHTYLKNHVHGVEFDEFAREIARLSLTLADIPNPNGWDLQPGDMFASNVLADEAKKCRIFLSNPPYERFKTVEKERYRHAGFPVRHKKAVELLDRSLRHLAPGAVFGVVVPQGVLHSTEAKEIRALLLKEFEIRELCLFADKLFEEGDAETAIIVGRRRSALRPKGDYVTVRRVREDSISRFAENYAADAEQSVPLADLANATGQSFRIPDLPEVWEYLISNPTIGTVAGVGQGFSFAKKGLIEKAREAGKRRTSDAVPAYLTGVRSLSIWQVPENAWLSPSRTPVLTWRSGDYTGEPQVLVNYSPVMRGPWRIKALLDEGGHAVTNTYTTVRPHKDGPSATFLWALLNSPVANAYVYCNALKRHIYDSLIESLPLPAQWDDHVPLIVGAAEKYLEMVQDADGFKLQSDRESVVREALLSLDAAVMHAYRFPVRLERVLLDLFRLPLIRKKKRRRKGVGCPFGDYFPSNFKSMVPLYKFISSAYRNSTVGQVADRMIPGESMEVLAGVRTASEAFGEDP